MSVTFGTNRASKIERVDTLQMYNVQIQRKKNGKKCPRKKAQKIELSGKNTRVNGNDSRKILF